MLSRKMSVWAGLSISDGSQRVLPIQNPFGCFDAARDITYHAVEDVLWEVAEDRFETRSLGGDLTTPELGTS